MIPSSSDLHYFLEAASSLNLSRAAERLAISQPSLTLAVQRLEASVGVPLLIRSRKGVAMTQAGKQLALHARELLQRWESVKGSAVASMSEVQGVYTIGCHPSVALFTLGRVFPELLEKYPRLELKLQHDLSRKIAESVVRLETDVGVVVNPVHHPDLLIRKLFDDEVSFWVGEGRRRVQDVKSGAAVLICDPDLVQSQSLLRKLKRTGIEFSRIIPSSNLEVITELVASGAGIGILPTRVAASGKARLRRVPRTPVLLDEICVLYRVENRGVKAIQAIVEAIIRNNASG